MPRDFNKSGWFFGVFAKSTKVSIDSLIGVIFGGFSATFNKHKTKSFEKNKLPQKTKVQTKNKETE